MRNSQRRGVWFLAIAATVLALASIGTYARTAADTDNDGLPDDWETQFGLDPNHAGGDNGASGDPDLDGRTNIEEFVAGTHPRGFFTRSFAEGATGSFYDVRFALFNPDATRASRVLVRYFTDTHTVINHVLTLGPRTRVTLEPELTPGLEQAAFSTEITSDLLVVADRTMAWDAAHYGSHAETGVAWPSTTWYFAEGATHSGFDLFYLVQNPSSAATSVSVTYLLGAGEPVERSYALAPHSRFNIWVNREDPRLAAADVSAVFLSQTPLVVERAMYLTQPGRIFGAGHASAGVTSPGTRWFLAEGATGDFFDLFLLIANPETRPADIRVTYLLPNGSTIVKTRRVAPLSRTTIHVDADDAGLASTAVSTTVESTNGTPILVERAMWWPGTGSTWYEAHGAAGTTVTSPRWALAEGETRRGQLDGTSTFILVSNTSPSAGTFRVTLAFEGGDAAFRDFPVPGNSRFTVDAGAEFPESEGRRYAAIVESVGATPLDLVVERAMYSNSAGVQWAAGTDAIATPLPPASVSVGTATVPVVSLRVHRYASESGPTHGAFGLVRTDATGPLTVYYSVLGTASPADYVPLSGMATFAPGVTSVVVDVSPKDDLVREPDETVVVTLASGPGYVLSRDATATVLIGDNDGPAETGISAADAARFLAHATLGATGPAIDELRAKGYNAWLDDQMGAPVSSFAGYVAGQGLTRNLDQGMLPEAWLLAAVSGPDPLRQRVANALLEILVVSAGNGLGDESGTMGLAAYMDILARDAFGNFRALMEGVTLSPAMGMYLNMAENDKEDPLTGRKANENYARELMQLFSIGLHQLNPDGTLQLDDKGQPIPTYGQVEVQGFAKVFTGWTFAQKITPHGFRGAPTYLIDYRKPMVLFPEHHSTSEKNLLSGVTIPASQTAEAANDLKVALDTVFKHPNVGPFLASRLIQRLITSNPSRGYVARVAAAFNNNGADARGDLKAVVKAILLDPEAREAGLAAAPAVGHLKEPMFRFAHLLRAFNATSPSGRFSIWNLHDAVGQGPFKSPSVFNFFFPSFASPGPIAAAGLVSPEFQITSATTLVQYANTIRSLVFTGYGPNDDPVTLDLSVERNLAATPGALLDRLDLLLFGGHLSPDLRQIVLDAIIAIPTTELLKRAQTALYLLATSPEFVVQK